MTPQTIKKYEAIAADVIASGLSLPAYCEREGLNYLSTTKGLSRARLAGGNCPDLLAARSEELRARYAEVCATARTFAEVAEAMGVTVKAARQQMRRYGLKLERAERPQRTKRMHLRQSQKARAKLQPADLSTRVTSAYISDVSGAPVWAVEAARKALGLPLLMTLEQAARVAA